METITPEVQSAERSILVELITEFPKMPKKKKAPDKEKSSLEEFRERVEERLGLEVSDQGLYVIYSLGRLLVFPLNVEESSRLIEGQEEQLQSSASIAFAVSLHMRLLQFEYSNVPDSADMLDQMYRMTGLKAISPIEIGKISLRLFGNEDTLMSWKDSIMSLSDFRTVIASIEFSYDFFQRLGDYISDSSLAQVAGEYDNKWSAVKRFSLMVELGLEVRGALETLKELETKEEKLQFLRERKLKSTFIGPLMIAAIIMKRYPSVSEGVMQLVELQFYMRVLAAAPYKILRESIPEDVLKAFSIIHFTKSGVVEVSIESRNAVSMIGLINQNIGLLNDWMEGMNNQQD